MQNPYKAEKLTWFALIYLQRKKHYKEPWNANKWGKTQNSLETWKPSTAGNLHHIYDYIQGV